MDVEDRVRRPLSAAFQWLRTAHQGWLRAVDVAYAAELDVLGHVGGRQPHRRTGVVAGGPDVERAVDLSGAHVPQVAVAHEPAGRGEAAVVVVGDGPGPDAGGEFVMQCRRGD